jgi:hypothetical protein
MVFKMLVPFQINQTVKQNSHPERSRQFFLYAESKDGRSLPPQAK